VRRLALTVLGVLLGAASSHAAPRESAVVHLCLPKDGARFQGAARNAVAALGRLRYAGYLQSDAEIGVAFDSDEPCFERAGGACYGVEGEVFCHARALSRILHAIAWASSSIAVGLVEEPNPGPGGAMIATPKVGVIAGLELADAYATGDPADLEAAIRRISERLGLDIRHLAMSAVTAAFLLRYDADPAATLDPSNATVGIAYQLYEAATNYLFAYVLGHELAHAFQECVHGEPSVVEERGLFRELVVAQARGSEFCPNPPLMDEVLADRCALRVAQRIDAEMVAYKEGHYAGEERDFAMGFLSFSRRLAIDGLSLLLMTGLGGDASETLRWHGVAPDGLPVLAYVEQPREGYLYAPIRLALFASLLNELEPRNGNFVRLCEDTAQRFVLGLNFARVHCGGSAKGGEIDHEGLAELFGHVVAGGVVRGWRTGVWDDRTSFGCPTETPALGKPPGG